MHVSEKQIQEHQRSPTIRNDKETMMHTITAPSTTMAQPRAARPYGLILYFIAAYAWQWLCLFLSFLMVRGQITLPVPHELIDTIGALSPLVAAIGVTAYEAGGAGVRALLRQVLRWRVRPILYAVALGGPLVLAFACLAVYLATGGTLPTAVSLPLPLWLLLPIYLLFVGLFAGGLDEELGWRGYALPRLQARYGALPASLILGVIWAFWHLPNWFLPDSNQATISFPIFLVGAVALSIILTWLYNSTGGSLLLVILAHTIFDVAITGPWAGALIATHGAEHGIDPFLLLTGLQVAVALGIVLVTNPRTLMRRLSTT
jgi:membrane protease YdiL (CAAX protease family)